MKPYTLTLTHQEIGVLLNALSNSQCVTADHLKACRESKDTASLPHFERQYEDQVMMSRKLLAVREED